MSKKVPASPTPDPKDLAKTAVRAFKNSLEREKDPNWKQAELRATIERLKNAKELAEGQQRALRKMENERYKG